MATLRSFDPKKPARCRQAFRFRRHQYKVGDAFPAGKVEVEEHKLWALWNARLIETGEVQTSAPVRAAKRAARAEAEARRALAEEAADKARAEVLGQLGAEAARSG